MNPSTISHGSAPPEMTDHTATIQRLSSSASRTNLWVEFVNAEGIDRMAEVGVYRGEFAEALLGACPAVERYYLLDPWRHLDGWNKPANVEDDRFNEFLQETLDRTAFAGDRRIVLRGTTAEVIDEIPDGSLDFAYVDGDHTLRGITVDLARVFGKVKPGGWIGGDDFAASVWQHGPRFEPTLVFPYAVYFAEAHGVPIYALPHQQFLIHKGPGPFRFEDLTGRYGDVSLRSQVHPRTEPQRTPSLTRRIRGLAGRLTRPLRRRLP